MGKFNNKISAEYNPPRKWILERALSYTNPDINETALETVGISIKGSRVTVKKGFVTDLASVPRMCWAVIAPWEVARAAIIHDLLYKRIRQYRAKNDNLEGVNNEELRIKYNAAKRAADDVFLMAMLDAQPSVPKWKIYSAYWSVRLFGYWSNVPNEDNI